MTLAKGAKVKAVFNGKTYEVAGFWGDGIVFAPVDQGEERCLIYTPAEVDELLKLGEFGVA